MTVSSKGATGRTVVLAILGTALALLSASAAGGTKVEWSGTEWIRGSADTQSAHPRVFIFPRDSDPIGGYLTGVRGDSLFIQSGNQQIAVSRTRLSKVITLPEKPCWRTAAWTGLLAVYLFSYLDPPEGQPNGYYSLESGGLSSFARDTALMSFGAGSIGAGLGQALCARLQHERAFIFTGAGTGLDAEFERLRRFAAEWHSANRLHLSVQGAYVATRTIRAAEDEWKRAGVEIHAYTYGQRDTEPTYPVNLLRQVEVSFSIQEEWRVGVAYVSLNEPFLWGTNEIWIVEQSQLGGAWFAIAKYTPLLTGSSRFGTRLLAGIGIGRGTLEAELLAKDYDRELYQGWMVHRSTVTEKPMCGYATGGLEFLLTRHLSLGVVADYVLGPSYTLKGIPEAGIPDQEVHTGQASIGLLLGVHI
jgi:hypothetical protein